MGPHVCFVYIDLFDLGITDIALATFDNVRGQGQELWSRNIFATICACGQTII
jgi:hypothetical protein